MRNKKIHLLVFVVAAAVLISGCSMSGNTATVTINTGLHKQAAAQKISAFDRILALLSFSTKAQADPPSGQLNIAFLTMSISGPGMSPMENIDIPLTTGSKTLEVPAGSSRVFTIVAFQFNEGPYIRGYGGITAVDLTPGDSVNVRINMGELPSTINYGMTNVYRTSNQTGTPFNSVAWWFEGTGSITGVNIYRAKGGIRNPFDLTEPDESSYEKIMTIENTETLDYSDYMIDPDYIYWYKISAYNEYGEGDTTDPTPDYLT